MVYADATTRVPPKKKKKKQVGCGIAPGSVLSIKLESGGIQDYEQMDVLMHDGSLLSDVSAGMQVGQHTLLGSPHSTGVLLCTP